MAKKEVSVRTKIVVEMPNDHSFRIGVKVNQNIAAENDVHALHEHHARVVLKVQTAELHLGLHQRIYLQPFAGGQEILLPEV